MTRRYDRCRIRTSGYRYDHWLDRFHPSDVPKRTWLSFHVEHFDTVEIDDSSYQLPEASTSTPASTTTRGDTR